MSGRTAILIAVFVFPICTFAGSAYDESLKGKVCKERENQILDCDYKIGKDLHISISGVGQSDAGVAFLKSNADGDYYGTFGVLHGCVIVQTGEKLWTLKDFEEANYAFISPRTGKVYQNWERCGDAR
jgi:hypothetical protein